MWQREREGMGSNERDTEKDGDRKLIFIFAWRHGRADERRDE